MLHFANRKSIVCNTCNNRLWSVFRILTRDVYECSPMYDTSASAISRFFYRAFIMIPETSGIQLLNRNSFRSFVTRTRTRLLESIDRRNDPTTSTGKNGTPSNTVTAIGNRERRISFYYPITINGRRSSDCASPTQVSSDRSVRRL